MIEFIFTNILMVAVGTVLYLVARTLPRLHENQTKEEKSSLLERWVTSEIPEKVDAFAQSYTGKLLRRLNVYSLRTHNYLTEKLKKIHTEGNGKPKIDLKGIANEKNGTESQ